MAWRVIFTTSNPFDRDTFYLVGVVEHLLQPVLGSPSTAHAAAAAGSLPAEDPVELSRTFSTPHAPEVSLVPLGRIASVVRAQLIIILPRDYIFLLFGT